MLAEVGSGRKPFPRCRTPRVLGWNMPEKGQERGLTTQQEGRDRQHSAGDAGPQMKPPAEQYTAKGLFLENRPEDTVHDKGRTKAMRAVAHSIVVMFSPCLSRCRDRRSHSNSDRCASLLNPGTFSFFLHGPHGKTEITRDSLFSDSALATKAAEVVPHRALEASQRENPA